MSSPDYRRLYEECLREKDELQTQFTEFQTSSTEFEEELQRELTQAHSETEKAKARIAKLETLVASVREEAEKTSDRSAAELQALSRSSKEWEAKCMQMRLEMRRMEQEKDNLERNCRVAEARAADLEIQVESLEEQCALLQEDVASAQEDHEEELRSMREELKDARSDLIRAQAAVPNQSDTIKSLQRQVAELQNQLEKLMIRHASSPSQSSRKSSRSPNTSAHSRQLSSPVPPLHDNVAASVVSALQRRSSVADPVGRGRSSSIENRQEGEERSKGKITLEVPSSSVPIRPTISRPATISFTQTATSRVPEFTANGISHSVPAPSARRLGGVVPRQPSIAEDTIEEEPANPSDGRPFIYMAGTADNNGARSHVFSPMPTTPRSPAPAPPIASRTHSEPSVMDQPTLTPSLHLPDTHALDPMLSPTASSTEPRDIPSSLSVLRRMLSYGPGAMHRSLSRSSNGTTPEPHLELAGLSLSPASTDDSRGFTSPFPTRIPDAHTRLPMPNLTRKFSETSDDGSGPVPSFAPPPRPPGVAQLNFNQMMPSPATVAKPMPLGRLGKSSTQSALLSRGTPRKPIDRGTGFPLAQVLEAFTPRSSQTASAPTMVSAGEALLNERLAALRAATGSISRHSSDELPPPSSSPPPPPPPLPRHPPSLRNLHQVPAPPSRSTR